MQKKIAEKSAAKTAGNAVFAVISQMIITLTPLITTPLVSRELGVTNLGIFSYTLTNAQYFLLFANLGIVNYATRLIAEDGSDSEKISAHFWEVYALQLANTLFMVILYFIYARFFARNDKIIVLIQSLWLIGVAFDISWFFYGIEEVKVTAIRGLIIKLLTIIGVFAFVRKDNNPLLVYTLIMAGSNLLGVLIILPAAMKYVSWIKPSFSRVIRHMKPNLVLFIPLLAMSIFHNMDKTMLGLLTSYEELGYYYNADKIINVPLQIINVLGTVFLPKATALLAQEDKTAAGSFLSSSFEMTIMLSCALAFGIAGLAKDFMPLFFGPGFEPCIRLTYLFVPVLVIKSIANFYRMEVLVPQHREKLFIVATFAGAGVNLIFNFILIPLFGAVGAVAATFMAETAVMAVQFIGIDDGMPVREWIRSLAVYLVIAVIMFAVMISISALDISELRKTVIEFAAGAFTYMAVCLLYWKYVSKHSMIGNILSDMIRKKA